MAENKKNTKFFEHHKSIQQAFKRLPEDPRAFVAKESAYETNQNNLDPDAMARIAPMIVFGSKIKGPLEYRNLIYADM